MLHRGPKILAKGVPDCLKKRRLLNEKELSPELCREYGEKFLALGWWEDALEFFQKGSFRPGLEKIQDHCLKTGDAYLLARLGKQEPEIWRRLAEAALKLGKLHFARQAFQQAGEKEKAEELAQPLLEGDLEIPSKP
ncbi:MAG: hypothetical protein A2Y80_01835 [Deltaproteobacteria bacterium RBG_13_58_19]|nr:MAG: hypothetical protein A2Y80_01835 [Deltaproteobacteria bacterium RBG_13_58_19]